MKNKVASLLLAVFFLMFFLPNQTTQAAEKRTALVMGNGSYRDSPLKNPVNDARDMAAALKALGFTVDLEVDAGQKTMELAIDAFGKKLRGGGVGLFYFAGHGMQVEGRNYLLPIGSTILAESDVKYEAVDGGRVLDRMNDAENGLNIVILDACRDNPFARSFRSASRGLARMDAPTGSLIVFATAPGSTAADGEGRNGIFTKNLLGNMKAENIPIEKVLKLTRVGVMNETRSRQVPWESSSLTGDFFFARTAGTTLTDSSAATQ
ncbi:MAG: caspase family protein, partial [Proteobacteria bacterium]|nr:caspase family protein [Pseudomonadota bacterium]